MYFEKLARSLRLSALAMCSVFLFACSDGDGPDEIEDPLFANCPGPNCVLNPVPPGPPPATANLLTNGSFEGVNFLPWINAGFITDTVPDGANDYYTTNVTAAGTPFSWNLSQVLTAPALIDGDAYTLNFRAKADVPRSMVAGIGEDGAVGGFDSDTRTVALTTEWQGFSFDLVAPGNVSGNNGRVLFDMGAEIGRVDIDDVSVTPVADTGNEHVTNGSFETAFAPPWENRGGAVGDGVIVEETGNDSAYNVNVLAAGAPFDVNLSQIFTITPGLNYKLTFRARTAGTPPVSSRTMLAGLGLNEPPFTADARTVLLLDQWRSYTYNFTAVGFGNANSRVLFDMGAAEGFVYIDDVFVSIEP